jgi:hypothetical protein
MMRITPSHPGVGQAYSLRLLLLLLVVVVVVVRL